MNTIKFFKTTVAVITLASVVSCDKDFNTIGSDVVADEHFGFNQFLGTSVVACNNSFGAIQTNNLPVNAIGIYTNSVFGKTRANFATQLELAAFSPVFEPTLQPTGIDDQFSSPTGQVKLDSVVLTIPYFDRAIARTVNANGSIAYKLDSIQGNTKIDLKVFENKYIITNSDPASNLQDQQKYYSNEDNLFNNNRGIKLNDDADTAENTDFIASEKEYVVPKRTNVLGFVTPREAEVRQSPRMTLHLNKSFFMSKIINAPTGPLSNNTDFKDYFRGLYFQVADAPNGSLLKLNFAAGFITMYWKEFSGLKVNTLNTTGPKIPVTFDHDTNASTAEIAKFDLKSYVINLRGNSVNLIEQTNSPAFLSAVPILNPILPSPSDRLWIKGGANGSVALIDLFGPDDFQADGTTLGKNTVPDELDTMRRNKWLINEANLVFHVDKSIMANDPTNFSIREAPYRVYLYDATNNIPIFDYLTDISTGSQSKFNKLIFGGLLAKNTTTGVAESQYKIRITNYIRNLVSNSDLKNVQLGLSVTEFIGLSSSTFVKNSFFLKRVPTASAVNHKGTVLFGNTSAVPTDKKLRLEIYYTKPN